MDSSTRERISREVSRSFPEMDGVRPKVERKGNGATAQFLLIFKSKARLPNGRSMNRIVRVVADNRGEILRISTSR
jgi:hypothetical protein